MKKTSHIIIVYFCLLFVYCASQKPLTLDFLQVNKLHPKDLDGMSAFLSEELQLTLVIQNLSLLSNPDSSLHKGQVVLKKMGQGKISYVGTDTIRAVFNKDIELSFCRNPGHMKINKSDTAFYLSLSKVRHMDGTISFVVKSGEKLYLPSFSGWSCRLLVDMKELEDKIK